MTYTVFPFKPHREPLFPRFFGGQLFLRLIGEIHTYKVDSPCTISSIRIVLY
jgi:hypothetical protein